MSVRILNRQAALQKHTQYDKLVCPKNDKSQLELIVLPQIYKAYKKIASNFNSATSGLLNFEAIVERNMYKLDSVLQEFTTSINLLAL